MLRHEALRDLSRDHFFVLVQCQRVRKALEAGVEQAEVARLAQALLRFLESDGEPHFREEDDVLTARVKGRLGEAEGGIMARVHEDHAWIRGQADALRAALDGGEDPEPILRALGPRLAAHARFEEESWFPLIQDCLEEAELQDYHAASVGFRMATRGAGSVGPREGCEI